MFAPNAVKQLRQNDPDAYTKRAPNFVGASVQAGAANMEVECE